MIVEIFEGNRLAVRFDEGEVAFLNNEADQNEITVGEMFEMLLGMLFVGGYSNLIGKD